MLLATVAALGLAIVLALVLRYVERLASDLLDLTSAGQSDLADLAEQRKVALAAEQVITKALRAELERARTDLADARSANQRQFEQVLEMRRDGFSMPQGTPLAPPSPGELLRSDPFRGQIRDAIEARARNRSDTVAMERFASDMLHDEIAPEKIAFQIMRGASLEELA